MSIDSPRKNIATVTKPTSLYLFLFLLLTNVATVGAETIDRGQGFIEVPGGPVWYTISGEGQAMPLITLHGGPGGTSCGFSLLEELGTERPVVRYDQLGTGRSGRPDDLSLWTVERYVEELHVVLQTLGYERVHLLGHSWGGALAAAYVLEKGTDGIASVILSSPLLSTPKWIADANYLRKQLPKQTQITLAQHEKAGSTNSEEYAEATAEFYKRHVFGGERPPRPTACNGSKNSDVIYQYMWGPTEFYATGTLQNFDVTSRLHEIDVPVLFMAGEDDEARPERMREFQQLIPGSRLHVIKDAAHASLGRQPEEYRRVLEEFLDVTEAQTAPH